MIDIYPKPGDLICIRAGHYHVPDEMEEELFVLIEQDCIALVVSDSQILINDKLVFVGKSLRNSKVQVVSDVR